MTPHHLTSGRGIQRLPLLALGFSTNPAICYGHVKFPGLRVAVRFLRASIASKALLLAVPWISKRSVQIMSS